MVAKFRAFVALGGWSLDEVRAEAAELVANCKAAAT